MPDTLAFAALDGPQPGPLPLNAYRSIYDEIAAGAAQRDAERSHPHAALDLLRRARFGAIRLPVEEGGGGASLRDVIQQAILLGEADTNVAHIYRNHFSFGERLLIASGDPKRLPWRQVVLDGGIIGVATTEIDRPVIGGTLPLRTRLTADGEGYRLNGTKFYSTGSFYAELIYVRAIGPDDENLAVIVPTRREGVELVDDWDGIGQRVTGTGTTNFHNVRIEAEDIVFERETPDYLLPYSSTVAQLFVTAVNAGILRAALRDAKALIRGRTRNFYYAPAEVAAEDPILQQTIGRIAADAFAAELVVLAAAEHLDRAAEARLAGQPVATAAHAASVATAKAKVIVDELVLRSTNALFDVGGASAATRPKNLDRHWRNARTLASHNPAAYKAQLLGKYELHGTLLPGLGFF
ncbi:acyl-CoA dehydrogenase family protein [Paracraurococcus lichenis]|uniref:Acyl-CoA dehydrogenase family protein n=1 Tax=Paracraurococcus lichenis TaxID=3064888 RepID=A0ABT9E5J4_9PROT|nr:acyl-CoA dehydrogenase family protein [Paracraurococcus sp. LOR1-02]MDO9711445.1 acyl-CoA dehydrogenase family protein [Paracraurococcus sp. LOR1-02]